MLLLSATLVAYLKPKQEIPVLFNLALLQYIHIVYILHINIKTSFHQLNFVHKVLSKVVMLNKSWQGSWRYNQLDFANAKGKRVADPEATSDFTVYSWTNTQQIISSYPMLGKSPADRRIALKGGFSVEKILLPFVWVPFQCQ